MPNRGKKAAPFQENRCPLASPPALEPPAKTPPGLNRPLGPTEAIYCLLDQLYCLNFVVFAEVNGNLDAPGLSMR